MISLALFGFATLGWLGSDYRLLLEQVPCVQPLIARNVFDLLLSLHSNFHSPSEKYTQALRETTPLVHCITNYVAMNIVANVTLAAGASPAMIHAIEEVADFAPICGALTVNIGTLSDPWVKAMKSAAQAARAASVPWVLDPVAHFATPYRAGVAKDLLALNPDVVRKRSLNPP